MGLFGHYKNYGKAEGDPITLAEIIASSRKREAAENAERERVSTENHAIFLETFRASIPNDDRFSDEEKQQIIAASYKW